MLFSTDERGRIANLLGLHSESYDPKGWVDYIEKCLHDLREDTRREEKEWGAEEKLLKLKRPRGRPRNERSLVVEAYVLALVYSHCTGHRIKNSTSHPFYKLCQICLRQSDPHKIISALTKLSHYTGRVSDIPGLASAKKIVRDAFVQAMKEE